MKKYFYFALICIGALLGVYGTALLFTTNFSVGTLFVILLGAVTAALGIFNNMPKALIIIFCVIIGYAALASAFLTIYGKTDTVTYDEDAIIVLGSAVNGETVGAQLARRLDAAYDYYIQNPEVLIVVSGGQGAQEDITEALAMERYLISRGVNADNIIKEEYATGTDYNFMYSKTLLDERLGDKYKVAFVTTDYHVFRAKFTARKIGFDRITHTHSSIEFHNYLPSTLRETVAVICYWLLK